LAGELEAVLQAAQAACATLEVAPRELERA
jgi:hypothetical protein